MRRSQVDMLNGPLLKNIIAYTVPIILTSLLQLLFNAADLIVVGRFCGSDSVAAVGPTGSLTHLMVNFFIGLSVGAGVIVARNTGARDHEGVYKTVHTAMLFSLIGGAFLTVVGVLFSGQFLRWMGTDSDVVGLSTVYMQIYFGGAVPMMVYNFGASILRAVGDTKRPLYFLAIAGVINVFLNLFFVLVFHMNVAGVALATTISQVVSAVLVVLALMKREDGCRLKLKELRLHKKPMGEILTIGVPAGIQGSLFSISNVIIQSSVNSFGKVVMAGCAAASNIEGFAYVTMNSFHQTALNFTGQNIGARNYARLRKIMLACLGCATVAGLFFGNLVYLLGPHLLKIYITDSSEAITYGLTRMMFIAAPYFLCGIMDVMTGCLRGIGKSVSAMVVTIAGVCGFRILWIYTVFQIPAFHNLKCLFMSYPISWFITFAIQWVYYMICTKKILRSEESTEAL